MKKNSELTYKEMYRQPASFQAVNDGGYFQNSGQGILQ